MLDGVIFDKDGTLFDFRQSWGGWVSALVRSLGRDAAAAEALAGRIGYELSALSFHAHSPVIAGTAEDIADALLPGLPGMTREALIGRMNALAETTPMAEAVPLAPALTALRDRGLRLGVATNDSEAPARAHLAAHGVDRLFDFVAGYDSGYGPKPGPGMLLAFSGRFALEPARVAMVGDSRHDLMAGRAAGMRTVAVLTGVAEAGDLAPLADVVLRDIGELGAWIDGFAVAQA
jgi:phosphoglycolate phosphatase